MMSKRKKMLNKLGRRLHLVDENGTIISKKKLYRLAGAVAALLILISAAAYTVFIKPSLNREQYVYMERAVERGDLVLGIMETGSIELLASAVTYDIELDSEEETTEDTEETDEEEEIIKYLEIEDVYAVSGQRIAQGDRLFKLTSESVEAVEKRLASLHTEAAIALAEARTEYEIQLLEAKSTYDTSMLEAERAESSYQASSTRTAESLKILSAEISILEAEIEDYTQQLEEEELWESLEEAQTAYAAAENLYQETDVHNATAHVSNYNEWKSAKSQLESIEGKIEDLEASIEENGKLIAEKQEEMKEVQSAMEVEGLTNESAYESAKLGGELAEGIYNYTVNALEEAVIAAEADMEEKEGNLEKFHQFVGEDGIIYAEGSGLVTSVSYDVGDSLVSTGEMLSYVQEDAYEVTIDVSEEDISAVSIGYAVDIVMAAYPDMKYSGTVTSITTTANDAYATTVSYPVTIKIEGDTSLLYGGMTANVTFVTDSVADVLYISKRAVKEIDGRSYVYLKTATGDKKLVEVETGFSDGVNVEIISGLSEGDAVFIESRISGSQAGLMESPEEDNTAAEGQGQGLSEGMGEDSFSEGGVPEGSFPAEGMPEGSFPTREMPEGGFGPRGQ